MTGLLVKGLSKSFDGDMVLSDVSFDISEGEFFCVVGPTNAGKSTLLKTIAGLHKAEKGEIALQGRRISDLEPRLRNVSLLFQNIALFPTMTGRENIAFPLREAKVSDSEADARVEEVAALLKVTHLLDRLPRTYSGGEQQRVAIGRAIAHRTDLLMLDEPLTNLDARIRIALRIEFKNLHRRLGQTLIYVTHDQVEAISMSDRIAVLNNGRFEQIGTPDEIYHRPASVFVAQFIGQPPMNILPAALEGEAGEAYLAGPGYRVPLGNIKALQSADRLPRSLSFGVRPETLKVSMASKDETPFPGEVIWVEQLGSKAILDLRFAGQTIKAVVPPDDPTAREGNVWLGFTPMAEHLINNESALFFR